MSNIDTLRAWHKAQVGTKEYPANSNNVRYNTEYYGRAVSGSSFPWCVAYQWVGFRECGLSALFYGGGKTASCSVVMDYAKRHDQWVTGNYKEGDLVLFDFTEKRMTPRHIGWVDRVSAGTVYTYEGNTSASDNANGGMVEHRLRRPSQIVGAFRPAYDSGGGTDTVSANAAKDRRRVNVLLPVLSYGMRGSDVKILQMSVTAAGFDCGGADGEFGAKTRTAVKSFQSFIGLSADGIAGVDTWSALFRMLGG